MSNTNYAISKDPQGNLVFNRAPLLQSGNNAGVTVGPVPTAYELTRPRSGNFAYLQRIEAVCLATGPTGGGFFHLVGATGASLGSFAYRRFPIPERAPAGLRLSWEFPTPLRSDARNSAFHILQSTSGIGRWYFTAGGFYSEAQADT